MSFQKYRECGSSLFWRIVSSKGWQFKSTDLPLQFQNPQISKNRKVVCFGVSFSEGGG